MHEAVNQLLGLQVQSALVGRVCRVLHAKREGLAKEVGVVLADLAVAFKDCGHFVFSSLTLCL